MECERPDATPARREHYLDGKVVHTAVITSALVIYSQKRRVQIDPNRAIPRQEHQRATKLFVGGLPGSVTFESMREFGKVVDVTVMQDCEMRRSEGFSFEDVNVEHMLGFGNL